MTESKTPRVKLSKVDGKKVLTTWKLEITDKANRKGTPDGYLSAEAVSDHIFKKVKKPVQSDYKDNNGADDRKGYMKQVQGWNTCESLASDAIKEHLNEEMYGIFALSRQSLSVHDSYNYLLKELSLGDDTLRQSLYAELDNLKQKDRETMIEYVSRLNKLKGELYAIEKDLTKQAAILMKLGEKVYNGMNDKSVTEYRGIILNQGARNDFMKIKTIVDEQVSDDAVRLATRGEIGRHNDAKAMSASGANNKQQSKPEFGPSIPGKLYVTNMKYSTTSEALKTAFSKFGVVDEVDVAQARGRPLGFGFVTFKNPDDAEVALKALNGKDLDGRKIRVIVYRPRKNGSAGMARADQDALEYGSAMSVVVDDDVEEGFDIPDDEYIDWNYGLALFASGFRDFPSPTDSITGLIDSGCSDHLSPMHFPEDRDRSTPIRFSIADGKHIFSTGDRGSISGYANTDKVFNLQHVNHVPTAKQTLISVHQLLSSGHDVWFNHSDMSVNIGDLETKTVVAKDYAQHGVFPLTIRKCKPANALLGKGVLLPPEVSWHKRMFHLNHDQLRKTQLAVNGMTVDETDPTKHCEECVIGKMHQYPHKTISTKDTRLLGVVSIDLVFPPKHIPSLGGATCFLGISVRSCGFKFGYALKRKSEVTEYLDYARKFLERQTNEKVLEWHMDAAGEHTSKILLSACKELGITITYTGTEQHQQNAEIEGWFRVAFDGLRAHFATTNAPLGLWADGLHTYCYIWNRSVHGTDTKTPYEQLFGRRPTVADLRVLFCLAYVRTLPKNRPDGKLGPRAVKGRFIGMGLHDGQPTKTRGYRILCDDTDANSVIISSDVYFVENVFDMNAPLLEVPITRWKDHHDEDDFDLFRGKGEENEKELPAEEQLPGRTESPSSDAPPPPPSNHRGSVDEGYRSVSGEPATPPVSREPVTPPTPSSPSSSDFHSARSSGSASSPSPSSSPPPPPPQSDSGPRTRSRGSAPDWSRKLGEVFEGNARSALHRWDEEWHQYWTKEWGSHFYEGSALLTRDGPRRVKDAIKDPRWKAAMDKEIAQMYEKSVFELTDCPPEVQPIQSIWVLKEKEHDITKAVEYKARLVLDGRQQIFGRDYDKTYAPTPSMEATKILAAIRTERNMKSYQIDFKGAFLNSLMDYLIYIYQPKGFEVKGLESKVIKINRALYGSCQASYLWNADLHKLLIEECGMLQCPFDPCVYKKDTPNGLILAEFHTDDGKIYADRTCDADVEMLLGVIAAKYPITRKDDVDVFLGIRIDYNASTTSLDQQAYLQSILADFQETTEERSVPWDVKSDQSFDNEAEITDAERAFMKTRNYYSLVGKFQYLVHTRPDISYYVNKLARYCTKARPVHWKAAQGLLAYLRQTVDYKLTFTRGEGSGVAGLPNDPLGMSCYSDADHAGDRGTCRSTSGVAIIINGGAVLAKSKRQATVADSTTAAEIIALYSLTKQVMWVRNMLEWCGYPRRLPSIMGCDNGPAVRNCEDGAGREKTKHMDIKYCFIRDVCRRGLVQVKQIESGENVADVLTKPLRARLHHKHARALGMIKGSANVYM
jgi:hypothetical protein